MTKLSPMMKHYVLTKEKYQDCILFYRLGDFYEMFFDDAELVSGLLGLTLTGKGCGMEDRAPMCGVPAKAMSQYVQKLLELGHKVAICEQLTDPSESTGLVERDVVRVITPGTIMEDDLLDEKKNNFIALCFAGANNFCVSWCDISTGEFFVSNCASESELNDCLLMTNPAELLLDEKLADFVSNINVLKYKLTGNYMLINFENTDYKTCLDLLKKQFDDKLIIKLSAEPNYIFSAGLLLNYLFETQKRMLSNLNDIQIYTTNSFMTLDLNTRRNLELMETMRDRKAYGSLLWVLDETKTSMGGRLLKKFMQEPLKSETEINKRLDSVQEIYKNAIVRQQITEKLKYIFDIERIAGKIAFGSVNPRDCISLYKSLNNIPEIKDLLTSFKTPMIKNISNCLFDLKDIANELERAINPDSSLSAKDGGFILSEYNKELKDLRNAKSEGQIWLANLEAQEKEETKIKNLKINYNRIFGYFIEVTNSQKELVPFRYVRKQTLAGCERYTTQELKEIEDKILNSQEKALKLEFEIFEEIKTKLKNVIPEMQAISKAIALLDVLTNFASVSAKRNYAKPIINGKVKTINIVDGRHAVVEALLKGEPFVPNDTFLDDNENKIMIITGPNMAGKSTYMRQVALITYLAHIGCFVPAKSAEICLTDRIFTRIGASDDLAYGQSTFMVEMSEVATILKNATVNGLVLLDEVGRGTATFDGVSIAWAVMEFIAKNIKCKTLFSTHYHELTQLEGILQGVKNYRVSAKEFNNTIIFLRKVVRGSVNKSFGIEVAQLAGVPNEVVEKSREILHKIESVNLNNSFNVEDVSKSVEEIAKEKEKIAEQKVNNMEVINIIKDIDLNKISPMESMMLLNDLITKVKGK